MLTKVLVPLLAIAGVVFAVYQVYESSKPLPTSQPLKPPPERPEEFRSIRGAGPIAGAGIVEARMENIPVGTTVPGVVWEVFVQINESGPPQRVKKGDELFRLDDRQARAQVKVKEAMLASAQAQLNRLRIAPRDGDVAMARAALAEAQARLRDAQIEFERAARLRQQNAITDSEYDQARYAYEAAGAGERKAAADLDRLQKTWQEDIKVAEAQVAGARSELEQAETELDRLTVRALADGEVLQVNVRPGQFAASAWNEPLIVLGDLTKLHVRVDIDEQDVPRFQAGARAFASLKGDPDKAHRMELRFVKVEPYVRPKRSLTGDNSERVDTRVLQIIYALPDQRPVPVYVGQQMDVYIEGSVGRDAVPALAARAEPVARPQEGR